MQRIKLEERLHAIEGERATLKQHTKDENRRLKEDKGSEQHKMDRLGQSWHDKLYHQAIAAGIPHNQAWYAEKRRRRAINDRAEGVRERADTQTNWNPIALIEGLADRV